MAAVTAKKMPICIDTPICPRCTKKVYFAEQVIALGGHWHKACFSCANTDCKRRLDSRSCADHNGEAYCVNCHRRMFGPKGYGTTLSMETPVTQEHTLKALAEMPSRNISHTTVSTHQPLTDRNNGSVCSYEDDTDGTTDTRPSSGGHNGGGGPISPVSSDGQNFDVDLSVLSKKKGWALHDMNTCRRCGKMVYFAERVLAASAAWHKSTCFTCVLCHKQLESGKLCEKDDEILCKGCYGRHFGPKGYGYGVGAGTLQLQQ